MHGDGHPGLQLLHHLVGLLGIDGIEAAHREEKGVQSGKALHLLLVQLTAQVAQMGHPQALGGEDTDGILAPQSTLLRVVVGLDLLHLDGVAPSGEGHQLRAGVVVVLMAAVDAVRLQLQVRQPGHRAGPIGVQHQRALPGLQGKAGVSIPCQMHKSILPFFFVNIIP